MTSERKLFWAFGFVMLAMMGALAFAVSLGKVEAQTSHGFDQILDILKIATGGWVVRAFSGKDDKQ